MAETAYSRYLKDQKEQEEVAKTTTPSGEIRTVDDAKKVLLKAIEEGTEPKKTC
jgi:CTP-dependent riboflavin kinase